LHELDGLELSPVQTNLIYMRYRSGSATELVQRLRDQGVLVSHMPPDRLRACLHLGISDADVDRAIAGFRRALSAA
jgi:threonine aldolase